MANARKAINGIHNLHIGNVVVEDEEEIKRHMNEFFQNLYTGNRQRRPKVDGLHLPKLKDGQTDWLERPFEENEVKKVVWLMDGDKAPSPNGFTLTFHKTYWEVI